MTATIPPLRPGATRELLAESRWLSVYRDRLTDERGEVYEYDHVALPGSVTVLAIAADGTVAVTLQRIYTHDNGRQWRLPAGTVEPGEAPGDAACRELAEETGVTGARWTALGSIHGADAATNHRDSAYLVTGLTLGRPCPGPGEHDTEVHWMPFPEVVDLVLTGQMPHAGSTFAVLTAALVSRC
jgi:8-oxo-dGDP phosphatase